MWGAGREARDLVYLKLSSGVGAGLLLDGKLYVGAGDMAGELGHTVVDDLGPLCRCGGRGCLETFVGGQALLKLAAPQLGPLECRTWWSGPWPVTSVAGG